MLKRYYHWNKFVLIGCTVIGSILVGCQRTGQIAEASLSSADLVIYVSSSSGDDANSGSVDRPMASLSAALQQIAEMPEPTKEIKRSALIVMREGVYPLKETIVIDQLKVDSLTVETYPGERVILSGGRQLSNSWAVTQSAGRELWSQSLPEVAAGDWYFRQLWVNGERATVPVLPKDNGFLQIEDLVIAPEDRAIENPWAKAARDRFIYKGGDISADWHAREDVWIMASYSWFHSYFKIKAVDAAERLVVLDRTSSGRPLLVAHPLHGERVGDPNLEAHDPKTFYEPAYYRVYNVKEALSEAGEFYLDRATGVLNYLPRPGEEPDSVEVVAPRLNQLLVVNAKGTEKVSGLHFKGITFAHSSILPQNHEGTGNNYNSSGDAAIHLSGLSNASFVDCRFTHLGEYAMALVEGTRDVDIIGNEFSDLGCGAIKSYGSFGNRINAAPIDAQTTMRLRITDNVFTQGGRFFPGHAAVNLNKTRNSVVAYNELSDFYFTGIHLGARHGRDLDFSIVDNQVLYNHIHDLGQGHWTGNDMGAVYVNGVGLGVDITGNVIHDITCTVYGGNGIYLDQEPCYVTIRNNLIYNTNYDGIHLKGFHNVVENNIVFNTAKAVGQAVDNDFPEEVATVRNNLLAPASSSVFHSKAVAPEDIKFISRHNLLWSLSDGEHVEVSQGGFIGRNKRKEMSFEAWRTLTGNDEGSVVAPISFESMVTEMWVLDADTLSRAVSIGFEPFDIIAGPRPASNRVLVDFKPDDQALHSEAFRAHVELIASESASEVKKSDIQNESTLLRHVQ